MARKTGLVAIAVLLTAFAGLLKAGQEYIQFIQGLGLMDGGRLSLRIGLGLAALEIFLAAILVGILWVVFQSQIQIYFHTATRINEWIIQWRTNMYSSARFGWLRYILLAAIVFIPLWVMQRLTLSEAFGYSARLILTLGLGLAMAVIITCHADRLVQTSSMMVSWILLGAIFAFSQAMGRITNYPFSLGWSEGNRFWDYSVRFGHRFYNYPADQPIFAYIDVGRQVLWGLPFLFAQIPIWVMRLWNGLVSTVPYAVLGWLTFNVQRSSFAADQEQLMDGRKHARWVWFLCGLWAFLFLNQGPIYTPLVLSAILVALAWRRPLWIAIPLVFVAGYYAQITRYTWMFAPAIWAGMLFFADIQGKDHPAPQPSSASEDKDRPNKPSIFTALAVFLAGLIGGFIYPNFSKLSQMAAPLWQRSQNVASGVNGAYPAPGNISPAFDTVSPEGISAMVTRQPLLWERLLPNPTFGPGILLALLVAVGPLIIFLIYLLKARYWKLGVLRGAALLLPLLAFLGVGLVVSVKIGGGGDLHNMDMFLVSLVFVAGLAWRAGGDRVVLQIDRQPFWVQMTLALMVIIFAQQAMSHSAAVRIPTAEKVTEALQIIQRETAMASEQGEVLFLDQRQLLTFGEAPEIPLVVDYEKKYLMDQALSSDAAYFAKFHADLARQRFALIISEPLKVVYQGDAHHFGNENDAWVYWVAQPILCYYEPLKTFKDVKIQLLVPRSTIERSKKCP